MSRISTHVQDYLCIAEPEKYDFTTSIVRTRQDNGRVLLKLAETYFHPTSGGEMGDTGTLSIESGPRAVRVRELVETQDGILHVVEDSSSEFCVGAMVSAKIDRKRRLHNKTHHTAGHIIFGVARKRFGTGTHYASFSISAGGGRIDLTVDSGASRRTLEALEEAANDVVADARFVTSVFAPIDRLSKDPDSQLEMTGDVAGGEILRLVKIPEGSNEVCCGVHCLRTSEVGAIRLVSIEKARRGVVSIRYQAGRKALNRCLEDHHAITRVAEMLGVARGQIESALSVQIKRASEAGEALRQIHIGDAKKWLESEIETARRSEGLQLIAGAREGLDAKQLADLARYAVANFSNLVVVLGSAGKTAHLVAAVGRQAAEDLKLDFGKLLREVSRSVLSGGGGGSPSFAHGGGHNTVRLTDALDVLKREIQTAFQSQKSIAS